MEIFHYLKHPSKQKRGELTCLEILDCTLKLIEDNNFSYERVTLKELSILTGHSIGTIYRYFDNKDDLLATLCGYFLSKIHTEATSIIDSFSNNDRFEQLSVLLIDHYLDKFKSRDIQGMITLYRLFIRSTIEPELIQTSIDILIPSFISVTQRNVSGTFPKIEEDTIRILLRGISSMVSAPLLENISYFHSDNYRNLLIKTAKQFINENIKLY
jgi:AcrR family transcriptional regulator